MVRTNALQDVLNEVDAESVTGPHQVDWKRLSGAVLGVLAIFLGFMGVIFFGVWVTTHAEPPPLQSSDGTSLLLAALVSTCLALACGVVALRFLTRRPREGRRRGPFAEDWQSFLSLPPPDSLWHRFVRIVDFVLWTPQRVVLSVLRLVGPFSIPIFGFRKAGLPWALDIPVGLVCGCLFWTGLFYGGRWVSHLVARNRERRYGV
jgi:hypothetical protein